MSRKQHRVCIGCGAALQTEDPDYPGYVPASALEKEDIICKRCFRITHYNEVANVDMEAEDFERILRTVGRDRALVIKVVDIFDFDGSWLRNFPEYIGNNPVLLAANKMDLLPKNMNPNRVLNWIRQSAKESGLKPVDVVLTSARSGEGIGLLVEKMKQFGGGRNIYVTGATNVGKSSLINRLLHDYGEAGQIITTSRFPGTTLDMIHIPLEGKESLIDTPGIINRHQISHHLTPESLKLVVPEQRINPKVYQLNSQQTLFLAGLARIDFVEGERQPFVVYASNRIYIHRTKLENADQLYELHAGELLSPPTAEELKHIPPLTKTTFHIKKGEKKDLVISGLGWIALRETGARIDVHVPQGVGVGLRRRLV